MLSYVHPHFSLNPGKREVRDAREYTEAHVRRMKNVVHTALGEEAIAYRNHVYSIVGEMRRNADKDAEGERSKEPALLDARKLKSISVLKMGNLLRIHAKTSDGGSLHYTNEKFEGIL